MAQAEGQTDTNRRNKFTGAGATLNCVRRLAFCCHLGCSYMLVTLQPWRLLPQHTDTPTLLPAAAASHGLLTW